ncbi:uncharacterized protein LOC111391336 [Olea europaea var. sylvestris]|uniref:uncharacterized protein LOC111391336 n=1 Tax=Olea europaea var. sylvestris TaxID=158386 RepID=UPI000C1D499B|nr:uncharacterized protein LOC111391336 [Olea europaea var. sylvestris]
MDFEFLIPEVARLRVHISQRSNFKYVKTVIDHFDERQREDFRNFPLGYLADVPDIQFSVQLIQQLVFRIVYTEKYAAVTGLRCGLFPKGDDFDRLIERKMLKERYFKSNDKISLAQLQSNVARPSTTRVDCYKLGLVLNVEEVFNAPDNNVSIHLPTLSMIDDLNFSFSYPWGRVGYRQLLHGFRSSFARKFQKAKRRKEKEITCTVHGFPHCHTGLGVRGDSGDWGTLQSVSR